MKQIFTISNQLIALGKRLAMVLTMLLIVGIGQVWGETVADEITFGNPGDKNNYEAIKLTKEGTFTDHNNFIWSCSSDAAISNGGGALSACYSYAGNKNTSSSYIEISWTADKDYNVTQFDLNAYANGDNPQIILTIDEQVSTITAPKSKGTTFYSFSTNNFLVQLQKGKKITARIQKDASQAVTGIVALKYTFVECTKETTVTLNPNGGSGTMDNVTTENGTLTLSECTFTRDGYTFAGWAISEEGEAIYEDKDVIDNWDANNTTLYAQWTPIEYQITYEGLEGATNGDNPNTYTVESETITFEEPGERVGYTFKGWEPEIIEAGSTGNVTIIATWEKIVLSNNCKWVEVTDNTTLEDGDEVVITMTWGATTWALPNNGGTSTPEVVVVNNVDGDKMLSVSNDMIWTVDEGDGNYSFYPMGSNATWLYCTNNNDGVRVGTGENKYFTIVNGLASDSENYFLYHVATSRYVGVYHPNEGIPDWRCYKLTDKGAFPTNIKNQSLKFYKKTCLMSNEFWIDYELANVTCTNTPPLFADC